MNQLQLGEFAPPLRPQLSQYHTPVKLARRMVVWAGVRPGMHVLEPSAGGGNIVRELVRAGAHVYAVEIDLAWARYLAAEFTHPAPVYVSCRDFLAVEPDEIDCQADHFDVVVMNPPLDNGVGPDHIRHALQWAPRVVSVLRGQDLHGIARHELLWSRCDVAQIAFSVRRPVYAGGGGQIETVIVDVRRSGTYHEPQRIEHWADDWR